MSVCDGELRPPWRLQTCRNQRVVHRDHRSDFNVWIDNTCIDGVYTIPSPFSFDLILFVVTSRNIR